MIRQFELKNSNLSCKILNYGATISDICFQNKHLVLRFADLENYRNRELNQAIGSTVGRVANRIANAKFHLNDQDYELEKNCGSCCLHGGTNGYAHKIWNLIDHKENELILELKSDHLDQNFPGTLLVTAKFTLSNDTLLINYSAKLEESNLSTIVNLTNHAYFNLDGCEPAEQATTNRPTILAHEVFSKDAKAILEQDLNQVSTGRLINLEDPLYQINRRFIQLREGCEHGLYDHSFAFETNPQKYVQPTGDQFEFEATSVQSKIKLTVRTDNFSCHMYTGPRAPILNYPPFSGVCFEAQAFANACNIPDWSNQCLVTKDRPYSKFISFTFLKLD